MVRSETAQLLAVRHGRASLIARDDDRLRDAGQGILLPQRRRCPEEGTHARHNIIGKAALFPRVHLLLNCSVDRRVTGMETHGHLPCRLCTRDHLDDLIERHVRRIMDLRLFLAEIEECGVHE